MFVRFLIILHLPNDVPRDTLVSTVRISPSDIVVFVELWNSVVFMVWLQGAQITWSSSSFSSFHLGYN